MTHSEAKNDSFTYLPVHLNNLKATSRRISTTANLRATSNILCNHRMKESGTSFKIILELFSVFSTCKIIRNALVDLLKWFLIRPFRAFPKTIIVTVWSMKNENKHLPQTNQFENGQKRQNQTVYDKLYHNMRFTPRNRKTNWCIISNFLYYPVMNEGSDSRKIEFRIELLNKGCKDHGSWY